MTVLSEEPASYSVAKAVWGYDAGDPFGTADKHLRLAVLAVRLHGKL